MYDVVTIGTATRDVFLRSPLFKIVHDPEHLEKLGFRTGEAQCFALGGKIDIEPPVLTIGGGALNAATTFARQGFKTCTITTIGNDPNGEAILDELEEENVVRRFVKKGTLGTSYSTILISPSGERTILVYRGASEELSAKDFDARALEARWAYITPGHLPQSTVEDLIYELKKRGVKVAMNPSKPYFERGVTMLQNLLQHLDVLILNREEASYLTGVPYENEAQIFSTLSNHVPGLVVMTEGEQGVMVGVENTIYRAGIFKERGVIDRTGAGDAFGSAFVSALLNKDHFDRETIHEAIRRGSANATSVVEQIGAQTGILKKGDFKDQRWSALPVDESILEKITV